MGPGPDDVLVVVSHYNARPADRLLALLEAMRTIPAGWRYRVRVVVNRAGPQLLDLPERHRAVEVCYRENRGYNIGAWDYGWRAPPHFGAYLFLQDECRLVRAGWVEAFVRRSREPGVGLVGELRSPTWNVPWETLLREWHLQPSPDHVIDGRPVDRVTFYFDFLTRHAIPPGATGDHLQNVVLFARREVLEAMDGFPFGDCYAEAVGAEIAISKKVQALGLETCEVGPEPLTYIEHPQWLHRRRGPSAFARQEPPAAACSVERGGPSLGNRRVALIYDDTARPETTGTYCLRALREIAAVDHFLPSQLDRVPRRGYDLYLNVDDGLDYRLPPGLAPSAWWAIDTHLGFGRCLAKAHDSDFVFAAQRDGARRLCEEGVDARWLPLACDPAVHRKHDLAKEFDVCFVGYLFPGPRAELLELIRRHFPCHFVGQRFFDEMARTYSASRTVFNRSLRNDVNMRVFEALACGSLLVTNDLADNGQAELFRDGVHLACYRDADDLLDRLRFYVRREDVRERVAAAGRAEALERHTYLHRVTQLLAEVAKAGGRRAVSDGRAGAATDAAPEHTVPSEPGSGRRADVRDPGYFGHARPEVLALIPPTARRVLDIGCGAGRLGEALKARQQAEVVGMEMDAEAGRAAAQRLDRVVVGDVEDLHPGFGPGSFDAVVCADVLEHLRRPARLLRRARRWLHPEGCVVASIPNVRHHSVVRSLLEGNWTYEAAGLLDRDHVRFFTRRSLEDLFRRSGYRIARLAAVPGPGYAEWEAQGRPGELRAGGLRVGGMASEEAEEFYAYQYLVVAVPQDGVPDGRRRAGGARGRVRPAGTAGAAPPAVPATPARPLRILYLGDFGLPWRHEPLAAGALGELGHAVTRLHEYDVPSPGHVLRELEGGGYDCLLFYKGRIAARSDADVWAPTGEAVAEVIRQAKVPCYAWYVDRSYEYDLDPSREAWMRRVAPLCRVCFVAEEALTRTPWARWHLLREPVDAHAVREVAVPEAERRDVVFLGQVYGERAAELRRVEAALPVEVVDGVRGAELSAVVRRYRVVLGPHFPCYPGYWGNRLYLVLGHGGFFLAPEIAGMREEAFLPGVHYAALGEDPVADVRAWLARPEERERIARAGQVLVLQNFTYRHRVKELVRVIGETL
jgi:2-polyprenyl-3-methyl-5-hydroxy-6-metoxy-1,4-benzoquinol methylase